MPIAFESIQDPYGIGSSGQLLGQMLFQSKQDEKQRQFELQKQAMGAQQKRQQGTLLQEALSMAQDPSASLQDRMGALQNYIGQTGDTSIFPMMKEIMKQSQSENLLKSLGFFSDEQPEGVIKTAPIDQGINKAPPAGKQKGFLDSLSENDLIKMAASGDPTLKNIADAEFKKRTLDQKGFIEERKYHAQVATPFMKDLDKERESLRVKRFAIDQMKRAANEGNFGYFSLDNLAAKTGIEALRTAQGAQLTGATKEFLLGNIARAGSRPNQWIEQQIAMALPNAQQSKEAALTLTELLSAETEILDHKTKVADKLIEQDIQNFGYVRNDIGARIDKEMAPIEELIQKKTAFNTRKIYETSLGWRDLRNLVGKKAEDVPLTPTMFKLFLEKYETPDRALDMVEKLGYLILPEEVLEQFE